MAVHESYEFAITIPAGTSQANRITTLTQFYPRKIRQIRWTVPTGPAGTVGFYISARGNRIVPPTAGQYIVRDGASGSWQQDSFPDSGDYAVTAYNTGSYPHTIYVSYDVEVIQPDTPAPELVFLLPDPRRMGSS